MPRLTRYIEVRVGDDEAGLAACVREICAGIGCDVTFTVATLSPCSRGRVLPLIIGGDDAAIASFDALVHMNLLGITYRE